MSNIQINEANEMNKIRSILSKEINLIVLSHYNLRSCLHLEIENITSQSLTNPRGLSNQEIGDEL